MREALNLHNENLYNEKPFARVPGDRRDQPAAMRRPRRFSRGKWPLVMIVIFPSKTANL
jgi:hypothetical protein